MILRIATIFVGILCIATVSCGQRLGTVEQTGTVHAVMSVDTAQLDSYFLLQCCQKALATVDPVPTDSAIQTCASRPSPELTTCSQVETAKFLAAMANAGS